MQPESLKKIIDMIASTGSEEDMKYVRISNGRTGMRVFTYTHQSVCNIFIPNETVGYDCMVDSRDKDFLTALYKKYKKSDVPVSEFHEIAVEYKKPLHDVDDLMSTTSQSEKICSLTLDFKMIEKLYKSMKQKSNNIRIDVTSGNTPVFISNEEGDISLLAKIVQ